MALSRTNRRLSLVYEGVVDKPTYTDTSKWTMYIMHYMYGIVKLTLCYTTSCAVNALLTAAWACSLLYTAYLITYATRYPVQNSVLTKWKTNWAKILKEDILYIYIYRILYATEIKDWLKL